MQVVNKALLVFGQAFNVDGYATVGAGNLTFLLVLPSKVGNKRAEAKSLNESFNIDF